MSDVNYWDIEPDGDTPEEMERALENRNREQERTEIREKILWERYSGYFGRNGDLVTRPPKH